MSTPQARRVADATTAADTHTYAVSAATPDSHDPQASRVVARPAGTPVDRLVPAGLPPLTIVVHGAPKSKGSMRHVGRGRMVEQVAGSSEWRDRVCLAARRARIAAGWPAALAKAPLAVEAMVTVAKPDSAPKTRETWPITQFSYDVDKHARNLLDALADAGVMKNDAQVISLRIGKRYPGQHPDTLDTPGALIRVRRAVAPAPEELVDEDERIAIVMARIGLILDGDTPAGVSRLEAMRDVVADALTGAGERP